MCSEGCRNGWPNYLYGTNGPGAAGHLFQEQFQVVKIDDLCTMTTMSHCTNLHLIAIYNVFLSQLSIGKMTHSRKQGRGIMDRSFKPIRMCFRRDCSYERMLEKSKAQLYSIQCQGASYYMADTSGTRVCIDGFIIVDKADGSEQQVPWTVETYIKMSNMKYPSKARFYCVEELPGKTDV